MKLKRKFSLGRIGIPYESIDIEATGERADDLIAIITDTWEYYSKLIQDKKVP